MENSKVFAKRLRELRGKIPQGKLGEILGVSRGSVSFYENEERTPDADFIINAANYFNVSTDYLLGLSEYRNQNEIDGLIKRLHELDGMDTRHKSLLLSSLGFISERLKYIVNNELKEKIISWLNCLLQSYANMVYLPDKLELDQATLSSLTSPHREAIHYLNELDDAIANELFNLHIQKNTKEGDGDAPQNKHND